MTPEHLDPHRCPALRGFLRGTFHEDFLEEHASAEAAAAAWRAAASPAERRALADEFGRLVQAARAGRFAAVVTLIEALGGAWIPADPAALESLEKALR